MPTNPTNRIDWRADLLASRDLSCPEKAGFELLLGWLEQWRVPKNVAASRDAARRFWKEQVLAKPRADWQLEQWAAAMRWFLQWLAFANEQGADSRGVEERVRQAVDQAGGRRGLALQTRRTYAGWAGRFARWAGDERAVLDEEKAREWLGRLVTEKSIAYSTQKQALNALAFFYRDVCGRETVDLRITLKQTPRRMPVVLSLSEVVAVLDELSPSGQLATALRREAGSRFETFVRASAALCANDSPEPEPAASDVSNSNREGELMTSVERSNSEECLAKKSSERSLPGRTSAVQLSLSDSPPIVTAISSQSHGLRYADG